MPPEQNPSPKDNLHVVRRFYQCFASGDLQPLREEILSPTVVWRVPGNHPLSGVHRGPGEVIEFFRQLSASRFRADILFLGSEGDWVVDLHRGWSRREDGDDIDLLWVLSCRLESGRIVEAQNFVSDQHAADAFFSRVHRLAPLPGRLAPAELTLAEEPFR